jgi:hypothetical protein
MASRSSSRRGGATAAAVATALAAVAVLAMAAACAPANGPANGTSSPTDAIEGPSASIPSPSPSLAGMDAPPDALLSAEGGDPVAGQLGTFVWLGTGSDSPWLPGAPLAVGAGEPLTVSLSPDGLIRAWTARFLLAGAPGPVGARSLAEGTGAPTFAAPGPGVWTVELNVEFAPGVGNASYFWRLEVE